MHKKVLFVDDDPNVLAGYQRNLRKQFEIDVATGGPQGLEMLRNGGPYAVIVADMQMPVMDGIEFLEKAQHISPKTVRIMLTGNADQLSAVRAVNQGHVFRFLTKPCSADDLGKSVEAGIDNYLLRETERELLDKTLNGAVNVLLEILSTLDPESFGHSRILREYVRGYAESMNLADCWAFETAAMLCPIGYITIPAEVLRKVRSNQVLSGHEKDMLVRVPRVGCDLISGIPRLEQISQAVLYHEKRFDGGGFPNDAIAGKAIPLSARLIKIFYDLIRLERSGLSRNRAIDDMARREGSYDPELLQSCLSFLLNVHTSKSPIGTGSITKIMLRDLKPGVLLASDVKTRSDVLIIAAGAMVTPLLLERLRNFAQVAGIVEPLMVRNDLKT
ncbi:MAG: Hydrogenase transcriptional regulatory protein hupR1 [Verrucomicrobiales bacterium]|nr:Hydrogenase transcriptional regulatory protein hupR1 [Verrucomicrobiales bacterium]